MGTDKRQSGFVSRQRLHEFLAKGELGDVVLDELLPAGQAHQYESPLWDYKISLPEMVSRERPGEQQKQRCKLEFAEIVKDAVSFYNSYGGYLVAGVSDQPREVVGFSGDFDCGDLNRRIKAATRHDIDCHFALCEQTFHGVRRQVGLLLVPRRDDEKDPAQFLRNAPSSENGKKAYKKGDIYFRQNDECKPAMSSEDYSFLCSPGRRRLVPTGRIAPTEVLDNNLGPRDPGLIEFIGREEYLKVLWRWMCDSFSPGKLLAGLGGVGKTTIAREFAEDIVRNCPMGIQRVIWLGAKKRSFAAARDKYIETTRVDFVDTDSLLRAILGELGTPLAAMDEEWTLEELLKEIIGALRIIPAFVVIDDVDSLLPTEQQEVFHMMLQAMGQTIGSAPICSRVLLTARLDLGASPGQLVHVEGLDLDEFNRYVEMTAKSINLPWSPSAKQSKKFHHVTEGSPMFATSILRLVSLGESLDSALGAWKGSEGEEVRRFAFAKELEQLSESQLRTLYAICILGETSQVELKFITGSSHTLLRDDIAGLRAYHLLALEAAVPQGGAMLTVPVGIRLMSAVIKERIQDPKRIERECARARKSSAKLEFDIGIIVHRVVALWTDNQFTEALEVAQFVSRKHRDNANLKCLLGRAYLRLEPPKGRHADTALRNAYDLGCRRTELIGLWIEAKTLLQDWVGIVDVTRRAEKHGANVNFVCWRAESLIKLANGARSAGHQRQAAEYFLEAGKDIGNAFRSGHARGRVQELADLKSRAFHEHVELVDKLNPNSGDQVNVWLAVCDAFADFVRSPGMIRLGVDRLESWWRSVESRDRLDIKAARLMEVQLTSVDRILGELRKQIVPDESLLGAIEHRKTSLDKRFGTYRTALDEMS